MPVVEVFEEAPWQPSLPHWPVPHAPGDFPLMKRQIRCVRMKAAAATTTNDAINCQDVLLIVPTSDTVH
jgi:hypothetical protein